MSVRVLHGDMREQLQALIAEGVRVQSIVTDPPYGLAFMGRAWDAPDNIAFQPATWRLCFELLPPGGHLLAFAGTRTYHRMACAIEDAGFELRDTIAWLYGSGFPKSHNVSKGIDKMGPPGQAPFAEFATHYEQRRKALGLTHAEVCEAGKWYGTVNHGGSSVNWANGYGMPTVEQWAIVQPLLSLDDRWKERVERVEYEREVLGINPGTRLAVAPGQDNDRSATGIEITAPGSAAARQWDGWGTALKPAMELISVARKPLVGTVAANVLAHGTGALNIDGCRIEGVKGIPWGAPSEVRASEGWGMGEPSATSDGRNANVGRWPANVVHDGSDEVVKAFPERDGAVSNGRSGVDSVALGHYGPREQAPGRADSGSAARFFYSSKADSDDRLGSKHPTVKPVDLMRWLVRLVTPPGGTCLDPFAGSGTTGMACMAEGFDCILVEREAEYVADIRARIAHVYGADTPLFARTAALVKE